MESRRAGLVVQHELIDYLQKQGLDISETISLPIELRRYLNHDGTVLQGMPQSMTSWDALYKQLRNLFPGHLYHNNKRFVQFEQDRAGVRAHFADGTIVESELLVAADGAGSGVRRLLFPEITPQYAGYVAWRGLIDEQLLSEEVAAFFDGTFTFYQMPQSHILNYFIPGKKGERERGRRHMNWVWYRNLWDKELVELLIDKSGVKRNISVPTQLLKDEFIIEMQSFAQQHLPPQYVTLVKATRAPFIQAIMDVEVPSMVSGRVVLLGDAAFVIRPHTAAGTAKAAADAMALGSNLRNSTSLEEALVQWNEQQMNYGTKLLNFGIVLGMRSQGVIPHLLNTVN